MSDASPPVNTTRLVLVFGAVTFASSLTLRALDPLLVGVALEFQASAARVALLASAFALPYALIQPLLGPVGDALGKRQVILACAIVLALALVGCALAPSLPLLFAGRVVAGLAAGGIMPLALATFGDAVPMEQRQVAMSRFLACAIGGQVAGGALAGLAAEHLGWRGVMAACALATAGGCLVLWRGGRQVPQPLPSRLSPLMAVKRYGEILRNPSAWPLFSGVAIEGALVYGMFPFLAALLVARGVGGTAEAGLSLASFGVGGLVYTVLAPLLLRGFGQPNMLRLGGATAAAGLLGISAAGGLWVLVVASLTLGLGYFTMHNSIQVRVSQLAPATRGSAFALHAFCFFMGQSLGPAIFGALQAAFGAVPAFAASAGGLTLLGLWLGSRRSPATTPNSRSERGVNAARIAERHQLLAKPGPQLPWEPCAAPDTQRVVVANRTRHRSVRERSAPCSRVRGAQKSVTRPFCSQSP